MIFNLVTTQLLDTIFMVDGWVSSKLGDISIFVIKTYYSISLRSNLGIIFIKIKYGSNIFKVI